MNMISIFGLGKLGKPLAESMATKGFKVIGVDVDDIQKEIDRADLTVLAVPWTEYRQYNYNKNKLLDCWRVIG